MATLEQISQELGVFQFNQNKKNNEINARLEKLEAGDYASSEAVAELANRIKILEESRQRQIAFNSTVALKEEVKSFWDIFK